MSALTNDKVYAALFPLASLVVLSCVCTAPVTLSLWLAAALCTMSSSSDNSEKALSPSSIALAQQVKQVQKQQQKQHGRPVGSKSSSAPIQQPVTAATAAAKRMGSATSLGMIVGSSVVAYVGAMSIMIRSI